MVGQDGLDVARPDKTESDPETARPDRREEPALGVGAQDDRHARRRFLERLQKSGLGILIHPVGTLDDRDAGAAFDRHQLELADQVLDAPVPRVGSTDDDLPAGTDRPEPMDIGMPAALDEAARPAGPARPVGRGSRAQQPGREVEREGRLADSVRTDEQDRLRRRAADHGGDRDERGPCPGSWPCPSGGRSVGFGRSRRLAGRSALRRRGDGVRVIRGRCRCRGRLGGRGLARRPRLGGLGGRCVDIGAVGRGR